MTQEAHKRAFFEAMDALRRTPQRPQPSEVARVALDSGLTVQNASLAVVDHQFGRRKDSETAEALNQLVAGLCGGQRHPRILEYTTTARLLAAGAGESPQGLTYVCPYDHVAEILQVLLD